MAGTGFSKDELLEILKAVGEQNKEAIASAVATAIEESKKPAPLTAQQQSVVDQDQEMRAQTGIDVKAQKDADRAFQLICSHEHTRREGGGTHCVWVRESFPVGSAGYILCQKCGGRFRPENAKETILPNGKKVTLDPAAHFNNATFNKLFQDCSEGEVLGG